MSGLSRNALCPCGTGKKDKHCCLGTVDWDAIERSKGDRFQHLSVRGRNLAFLDLVAELLLLDSHRQLRPLAEYKRAFTAQVVRTLNEGIARIWPKDIDVPAALRPRDAGVSALYVGDYSKDQLLRGLVRHSTYATKLLVCDPFLVLSLPDGSLLGQLEKIAAGSDKPSKEDLLAYVHRLRAEDPDFLEPMDMAGEAQLQMVTSGASYNIALLTASMTTRTWSRTST